jgi:serine/threonine-protein kinase HipA
MPNRLLVLFEDISVGHISREASRLSFTYSDSWLQHTHAFALSLNLPLRSEPYDDGPTRAYFNNLLPEEGVRAKVATNLHVSEKNVYGLLEALGAECAGALSIVPENNAARSANSPAKPEYIKVTHDQLGNLVANLPHRPLLAGEEGVRLSLAGAQSKLPLAYDGKRFLLPLHGSPSTHILKPPIRDLEGSVDNEAFIMILARGVGLPVPSVFITDSFPRGYVVERYDRYVEGGTIRRLHQEDFCQALGVPPEIKYENEGGPGLQRCFEILEHSANPDEDKRLLLMWVIFNFLAGNADTHAKNLSLLYSKDGIRLAPFYDLLCTGVYGSLTQRLAMKIGGKNDPDFIFSRHWSRLAVQAGVDATVVLNGLQSMAELLESILEEAVATFEQRYGTAPIVRDIATFIMARCERTLQRLGTNHLSE